MHTMPIAPRHDDVSTTLLHCLARIMHQKVSFLHVSRGDTRAPPDRTGSALK
jgi:hypothetical protein